MRVKLTRTVPALAMGILVAVSSAQAAPANRLYIKKGGKIAFAIDPSGNTYSRSYLTDEWFGGTLPGFQFRINRQFVAEVFDEIDSYSFGAFTNTAGRVYENFSTVPYRSSGSFVFYYRPTSGTKTGMMEVDNGDGSINVRGNYVKNFSYRKCTKRTAPADWANLKSAWQAQDGRFYPGSSSPFDMMDPGATGGVSYWDKQDQIHHSFGQHTMDGQNLAFLPWHREFINRFEDLLRQSDPLVSLPYWDWTTDPRDASNTIDGVPLVGWNAAGHFGWGFTAVGDPFTNFYNGGTVQGSRDETMNPADPPAMIMRSLIDYYPTVTDNEYLTERTTFSGWEGFARVLEEEHGGAHNALASSDCTGCNISDLARAVQDPMFFLIHANADRIWARWQLDNPERRAAGTIYEAASVDWPNNWVLKPENNNNLGTPFLDPWSGGPGSGHMGGDRMPIRPWRAPDGQAVSKSYIDPTILNARGYESQDGSTVY